MFEKFTEKKRGRPFGTSGPPKTRLVIHVTPEVAEWLRDRGLSRQVEAMARAAMGTGRTGKDTSTE